MKSIKKYLISFFVVITCICIIIHLYSKTDVLRNEIKRLDSERQQLVVDKEKLLSEIEKNKILIALKDKEAENLIALINTAKVESSEAGKKYLQLKQELEEKYLSFSDLYNDLSPSPESLSECLEVVASCRKALSACDGLIAAKDKELNLNANLVTDLQNSIQDRDIQIGKYEDLVELQEKEIDNLEEQVSKYKKLQRKWIPQLGFGIGVTCGNDGCIAGPTIGIFWKF